jgi:hypothetical protein
MSSSAAAAVRTAVSNRPEILPAAWLTASSTTRAPRLWLTKEMRDARWASLRRNSSNRRPVARTSPISNG